MVAIQALLILLKRGYGGEVLRRWRRYSAEVRRHCGLRRGHGAVIVGRVEVHETECPLGMCTGEGGELVAAQRMPDEHRAGDRQRVEDRGDLRDPGCQFVTMALRLLGFTEPHPRERDDAEV